MVKALTGGFRTRHPNTFRMYRPMGISHYVLLIVRSYGEFQIGSHFFTVTPDHAILFAPCTGYSYGNPKGDYVNDWLHFEVTDDPILQERLDKMTNVPFSIGNHELYTFCIHHILLETLYSEEPSAPENSNALFTFLFNHLSDAFDSRETLKDINPLQEQLQLLRLQLEASLDEEHSIQKHAKQLQISESYFQSLYKSMFGIPFGQDLIQMRVEHAKSLLTHTNLSLHEIMEACGYTNEVHFHRQFKQITGTSPASFRRNTSSEKFY